MNVKCEKLDNAIKEFLNNMKNSKNILFDKDYVKVKKEIFDSMNIVIKETNNFMKVLEKVKHIFVEVDSYVKSYNFIQNENEGLKMVEKIKDTSKNLEKENNKLERFVHALLNNLKRIFKKYY